MAQVECNGCGAPLSHLAIACEFCGEKVVGTAASGGGAPVSGGARLLEDLKEIEEALHSLENEPRPTMFGNIYKPFYWYFVLSTFGVAYIFLPKPAKSGGWGKNDRAAVSNIERKIDNARDLAGSDTLARNRLKRAEEDLREVIHHRKRDKQIRYGLVALPIVLFMFALIGTASEVEDLADAADVTGAMEAQSQKIVDLAEAQSEAVMKAAEQQAEAAMLAAEAQSKAARNVNLKADRKPMEPKSAPPVVAAPVAPPAPVAPVAAAPAEPPVPAQAAIQTGKFIPSMMGRWRGRKKGHTLVVTAQALRSFGVDCKVRVQTKKITCQAESCIWIGPEPGQTGTLSFNERGLLIMKTTLANQACEAKSMTGPFKKAKPTRKR